MAEDTIVMCDTNIIIELFKNNKVIKKRCFAIGENNLCISAVTAAEFYYGTLNKREFNKIKEHISNFPIIHINDEISKIFLNLMLKYCLSHKPFIGDMLIAATSIYHDIPLLTLNTKDFQYINRLILF